MKRLFISTHYGPRTFALIVRHADNNYGLVVGTATPSGLEPGTWLIDTRRTSGGFATHPKFTGSLLGALHPVRRLSSGIVG